MAQHNITLPSGQHLPYQLERRARRTVGLKITAEGLVIHAPARILHSQLEQIILDKSGWIQKKLHEVEQKKLPPFAWQSGETLLLYGQTIRLEILESARNKKITFDGNCLQLATSESTNQRFIARKVLQWYQQEAATDLARRLAIFAAKLGVATPAFFLSNAKSRWGSCNSRKEVRLNWRLIQAPPHIINYVVCHELAHLKEMNHSAKFWRVVAQLFPDYKQAEKELKLLSPHLHRLN